MVLFCNIFKVLIFGDRKILSEKNLWENGHNFFQAWERFTKTFTLYIKQEH